LGIAITLSDDNTYYGFEGKISSVVISFHDQRIIQSSLV
jgi:hypothetical protein